MSAPFHIVDEAFAVLVRRGVYKQAKVYRRGTELFAGYGGGFVRLYVNGTSIPDLRLDALDVPFGTSADAHGRLSKA